MTVVTARATSVTNDKQSFDEELDVGSRLPRASVRQRPSL
jgi:hypothetical protein